MGKGKRKSGSTFERGRIEDGGDEGGSTTEEFGKNEVEARTSPMPAMATWSVLLMASILTFC